MKFSYYFDHLSGLAVSSLEEIRRFRVVVQVRQQTFLD